MTSEVYHTTDGSGDWMCCWVWEFQKSYQRLGWTNYLYFTSEELANKWLNEYVIPGRPGITAKVKLRLGTVDHFLP